MSRLTKHVRFKDDKDGTSTAVAMNVPYFDFVNQAIEKLAHYEDLEEQGRLIELPCKVGDELFVKHRTFSGVIVKGVCIGYTWWRTHGFCIMFHSDTPNYEKVDIAFSEFGKTIFLTKAEAEAKLAELKGGAER